MDTRKWVRWQDWAALVIGLVVLLTPLWFDTGSTAGTWMMVIVGALLAVAALWSLAVPGALSSEWAHAIIGVLMVLTPWIGGFASEMGAALTAWIGGVLAIIVGLQVIVQQTRSQKTARQQ